MEQDQEIQRAGGFWLWLTRAWFALTRRKIRLLHAGDITADGPALFAVSHPVGFLHALVLAVAMERPVHCLLPQSLARGPLARFLARQLGMILFEDERPLSEAILREGIDVLSGGGALVVFADAGTAGHGAPDALASTAAALVWRAEAQHVGRRVAVHPVHLFLSKSTAQSREILIYVDLVMDRPEGRPTAVSQDADTQAFATTLETRFQENAFQLRPADLEYFLGDLEEVLRTGLQEDWASRPEWKQDTDGFVLSRLVTDWVRQTNCSNPARLVTLRKSLEDHRRLQKECALRELEVEGVGSPLSSGWRRSVLWLEAVLGLPIALFGLLNHLAIVLVLFLARSFKGTNARARSTEWTLRGAVILVFYTLQIFLVAHWRGRAAAGYYAPTLPVSGIYLWRYVGLLRPQARLMFIALTIPPLTRKIKHLRRELLEELDRTLTAHEEKTSVPQ
jgi:hypothetical protein